jgi:predicted 3-demethylubiquinone-9 3-methyltransferase (glyoxalase superfamily)
MDKLSVCLWFDGKAEDAARFYCATFKNSRIGTTARYGEAGELIPGRPAKETVMTVEFELDGLKLLALNGGPLFSINPAISLFVSCDSEEEIDRLYKVFSEGGQVLMPLQEYPFAPKYAWVQDKFGVSWQLIQRPGANKVVPCLLFAGRGRGKAADAIEFYKSQFPNSKTERIEMYPPTAEFPKSVMHASVIVNGQELRIMDANNDCPFEFNPAVSFVVYCKEQADIDDIWHRLAAGGTEVQCGWVTDRYGVSWQVVPEQLPHWMRSKEHGGSERVMAALLKMKKLDIASLLRAFEA